MRIDNDRNKKTCQSEIFESVSKKRECFKNGCAVVDNRGSLTKDVNTSCVRTCLLQNACQLAGNKAEDGRNGKVCDEKTEREKNISESK